jgi:hypothetical protein
LIAALIVAAAVMWAAVHVAGAVRAARSDPGRGRTLDLIAMFAPAVSAAASDPRALLVWQPLARTARKLFPEEFATLDAAAGGPFPFTKDQIEAAHARWTADWLAWELAHDATYKLKVAEVEHELAASGGSPLFRARLDAVEREKLDQYQRRYAEYVRVAKAIQGLAAGEPA